MAYPVLVIRCWDKCFFPIITALAQLSFFCHNEMFVAEEKSATVGPSIGLSSADISKASVYNFPASMVTVRWNTIANVAFPAFVEPD